MQIREWHHSLRQCQILNHPLSEARDHGYASGSLPLSHNRNSHQEAFLNDTSRQSIGSSFVKPVAIVLASQDAYTVLSCTDLLLCSRHCTGSWEMQRRARAVLSSRSFFLVQTLGPQQILLCEEELPPTVPFVVPFHIRLPFTFFF